MTAELLIFVGYSSDAKEEALAIRELKPVLQDNLKGLNHVAAGRAKYSHLDVFNWESDSEVGVGGQEYAINPFLRRAAIALFVFKGRVGSVTRQELESCRDRSPAERIPTFVLFPDSPPDDRQLLDRDGARAWADLLELRHQLTAEWSVKDSRSITPLPGYRDKDHLKEILRLRLADVLPSLMTVSTSVPSDGVIRAEAPPSAPKDFLDSLFLPAQYDVQAVQRYRDLLRRDLREEYPAELSVDEFLERRGYTRGGSLTVVGVLLFNRLPSRLLPSALVRCSKYDGVTRGTTRDWQDCEGPLLQQIMDARDFVADNVRRREQPVESSMLANTLYEYPMLCVREVLGGR